MVVRGFLQRRAFTPQLPSSTEAQPGSASLRLYCLMPQDIELNHRRRVNVMHLRQCEQSKTVATFIVQKIVLDDVGLDYIRVTAERFLAVGRVLGNMAEF
ncbi:hypothetical protein V6N12_025933 [Hibiscus sabdariffa]|uniref:Uncharacterized protein n=1 Tax=Hibiscus sabdariffa TaxID=183260 RepID=A0ABR2DQB1_9ROSI